MTGVNILASLISKDIVSRIKLSLEKARGWIGMAGFLCSVVFGTYVLSQPESSMYWAGLIGSFVAGVGTLYWGAFHNIGTSGCMMYDALCVREAMHVPKMKREWRNLSQKTRDDMGEEEICGYYLDAEHERLFYNSIEMAKQSHVGICEKSECRYRNEQMGAARRTGEAA